MKTSDNYLGRGNKRLYSNSYHLCQFFRQNKELWLFGPKFSQKLISGSKFQKPKSGFGISTSKIPFELMFSENGQFWIFRPKFGEIAQLRAIFWFEYLWGCCRELGGGGWSCAKGEMSWVERDGAGWKWVEVDGTGWRWVHGLVIPVLNFFICILIQKNALIRTSWHYNFFSRKTTLHKIWKHTVVHA